MKITNICIGTSQKNVYKISHLHDIFLLDYCNWFFLNAFYFATLRGEKHGSCHIWTLGFLRSPKHNKILEDVYFSITKFGSFLLWMVAIVAKITKLKEKKKKPWLEQWNILLTLEPNVLTFMSFALRFTLSTYPFPKMDGTKGWWFNIKQIFTSLFLIVIHIFFYIRYITFSFSFLEIPRFASTLSKFENDNFHLNKFPCDEKKFKFQFSWQKVISHEIIFLKFERRVLICLSGPKILSKGLFFPCFTRMQWSCEILTLQEIMVYLTGKLDQKPIILTFGKFDHLVILDKSIWTCPTWLVVFLLTIKWSFWIIKSDKKLGSQNNLIKK